MKVDWSPLAIDRLAEIAAWIAADRPDAASKLVDEIFDAVECLRRFPESGRQIPEFERTDLREVIHRAYRIIYRVQTSRVEILTVRHSLQLLEEGDLGE